MKLLNLQNPLHALALATALAAAPLQAAFALDTDAATAQARVAADAAHEVLVDRYRALWQALGGQQKAAFAQRERAWLNEGRADEERRCVEQQGAHAAALAAQLCRLKVTEQKLASLPAVPATVASAR